MKLRIFLLSLFTVFACYNGVVAATSLRPKRDAAGALHIVTNHVQPIHADVKPDAGTEFPEKPCPKNNNLPSHIENGVVFQVTPPEDAVYQPKSLRKSLSDQSTKINLVRNIGRIITLVVLVISAVLEFYPLLETLFQSVYKFLYL